MTRWYKRCGADFIHGTMSLSLEEKGAYSLCLDLIYDRGGAIPDDARWLSGICGVSMRKWNSLRQSLIEAGKLASNDGLLMNARAGLELVSMEFQRRNQAEAGAKGGRKRAENDAAAKENNDLAQATLKPIEEIREDKKEKEEGGVKPPIYAFCGSTIRLRSDDLEKWRDAFHAIPDFHAELASLDAWFSSQPEVKRKAWFHTTAGALNRKHQEMTAAKTSAAEGGGWDGMP